MPHQMSARIYCGCVQAIAIRRAMDDGLAALTTYWRDEVQGFRHQLRSIETHIHAKFTTLMVLPMHLANLRCMQTICGACG